MSIAAKKTRRAPRREVGDLVERITSWCADGPSGRRLAGCAEDLLNFSSAAYGEAGEVWCISYGRVLERLFGEPEAIEAAAVALAGRNLDGRQAARRICAPAARIARGRFPDPAPPPHERAGARKAAAAALRRFAERGADLADDRYAREALARACAGCLRNLYVEEKLDDEAPAVEVFQALAALHARAPADAARLAARGRHGLGHVAARASRASRIPVEARRAFGPCRAPSSTTSRPPPRAPAPSSRNCCRASRASPRATRKRGRPRIWARSRRSTGGGPRRRRCDL